MHVAMDEVLTRDVGDGIRNPTLRFWEWESPSVVIGSFQSLRNEVDPDGVARHGVSRGAQDQRRRRDVHGTRQRHHLLAVHSADPRGRHELRGFLPVPRCLGDGGAGHLGIKAWYQPLNDIATDLGKIGGAAQKRLANGGMLHHVTMSYDIDADKMLEVLRIGKEKLSDKGTKSAKKRVDPLRRQTGLAREEIIAVMIETFRRRFGAVDAGLSEDELRRGRELVEEKFATEEWLYRVP
jgi:lipoate-protein ligase A